MFSKHLEDLIQATLQDGILEDYEKEALLKAAKAEGVDPSELQIYINSILQKRSQEKKAKKDREDMILERERIAAKGKVCPNCGRQVPPLTLKCVCGYEFTDQKSASSVEILSSKIDEITKNYKNPNKRDEKIRELISYLAVPNTKEDIIEFLALAASHAKMKGIFLNTMAKRFATVSIIVIIIVIASIVIPSLMKAKDSVAWTVPAIFYLGGGAACAGTWMSKHVDLETIRWNKNAVVWRAKFEQVLMKGRSLQGDPDFQRQLDYYENVVNGK